MRPCGQGMVRTRAPGRRPHRRPCRCRGRSPVVVVVPVQRRNHPLRPGTVPLSRREASPSAGWRMPVVVAQMVQRRRRRLAGPPVQWRAPERSEGGCGDGRRGDGGSRLRGDDGYPVQSGGENHCRCRGDENSAAVAPEIGTVAVKDAAWSKPVASRLSPEEARESRNQGTQVKAFPCSSFPSRDDALSRAVLIYNV